METEHEMSMDTLCVHAGMKEDGLGAVVTPIYQTSTFKFTDVDHGAKLFKGEEEGYIYTRMRNPTVEAMEQGIAALEGGVYALGCGSGMAATHTLFSASLASGDHVVCSESVYGATATLLSFLLTKFGIETTFVDTSDLNAVSAAMRPTTKLVYVETPGNPTLVVSDMKAIAEIAHSRGARMVVDNTFMSPALQQPFKFGADYIIHSLTKFLNGHADVIGGIIVLKNEEEIPHFRKVLNHTGGVIDPFNAFLVHRGMKTLHLRMERHSTSAQKVAEFLEKHPKVDWVMFPGLPSHPQYEIARKQMLKPGGVISFEVKSGLEGGKILLNNTKLCQLAVSLGGVETLIQHPASMTHAIMSPEQRLQAKITDGLVRLSVGIEDCNEIIHDLHQALAKI